MSMGSLKMVLNALLKHWVQFTEFFNITVHNSNVFVVNKKVTSGTQWNESFTKTQSVLLKTFSGNSCSFLPALLKEHGDRIRASVYRSPELKEYLAWIHPVLPYIIEVHHMKIYAFDDNLIVGR